MQKDRMYGTLQLEAGTKGKVSAGVLEPSEIRRCSPLRQKPQGQTGYVKNFGLNRNTVAKIDAD